MCLSVTGGAGVSKNVRTHHGAMLFWKEAKASVGSHGIVKWLGFAEKIGIMNINRLK